MIFSFENSGIETEVSFTEDNINEIFIPLLKRLTAMQKTKGARILVMLAAPPGAGKSTLAGFLEYLSKNTAGITPVTVIGMDGFHRRQEYLISHSVIRDGREIQMVKIKGAPVTFDLEVLTEHIARVASGKICGWPEYNRMLHNPVDSARTVDGEIVLLEGNYLLLEEDGWNKLRSYADYTIGIIAKENILRERFVARKIASGATQEEAESFVEFSDMHNVRTCLAESVRADLMLRLKDDGSFA